MILLMNSLLFPGLLLETIWQSTFLHMSSCTWASFSDLYEGCGIASMYLQYILGHF